MSSKPVIMWEKWRDPYGSEENVDINSAIEDMIRKKIEEQQDNMSDIEELPESINNEIGFVKHKMPMMITPMGLIPLTEHTAPGKIFNFWTGHSNFNITQKISDMIEETTGVETLDVFTRYRFRIGIGKAFKDSEVMHDINKHVYSYLE
jgi:hypothetical protein